MREVTKRDLTDAHRHTLDKVADVLIPAFEQMPSASSVGVSGALLDKAIDARPDMLPALLRGLDAAATLSGEDAAHMLFGQDRPAFDAIATLSSGAYYMDERVRELIGYPGQERIEADDPYALQPYALDGTLKSVFERGPIYRPTPGEPAKAYPRKPTEALR